MTGRTHYPARTGWRKEQGGAVRALCGGVVPTGTIREGHAGCLRCQQAKKAREQGRAGWGDPLDAFVKNPEAHEQAKRWAAEARAKLGGRKDEGTIRIRVTDEEG